jgi:predicted nucleotidyltransferase component of viral defense system
LNRPSPKNVAHSIHQRLLNMAKATGRPFNELLQYFAMERLLYRLSKSPHAKQFILKGALMLTVWRAPRARSTLDIDLLARMSNRHEDVAAVLKAICVQPLEPDGLSFDPDSVETEAIAEDADYKGVRTMIRGRLGNARVSVQVDMGFSDVVVPEALELDYPTLLDLPAPHLRGYSRESAVAEKFEAMTKLDILNSRMKDFYDIWLLARQFDFDGATLAEAVSKTFANRGTAVQAGPPALSNTFADDPGKQAQWSAFRRKGRAEDIPAELKEVIAVIADFLGPVAQALASNRKFDAVWKAPGLWSSRSATS